MQLPRLVYSNVTFVRQFEIKIMKRNKLFLRARKSKDPDVKIHNMQFRAHVQEVETMSLRKRVPNENCPFDVTIRYMPCQCSKPILYNPAATLTENTLIMIKIHFWLFLYKSFRH